MSAPRHLWSGDWELESSAHAEDLAARRGRGEEPAETEPAAPKARESHVRQSRVRPSRVRESRARRAIRSFRGWLRGVRAPSRRRIRVAALVGILALLVVAGAYAVTSGPPASRSPQPAALSSQTEAWLGVDLTSAPVRGAVVAVVVPGSPAAQAGIRPGDVITQLDTEPIQTPAIFVSAISGMQPGETVDIQLQRGGSQYTVHAELASRPARNP